MLAWSAARERQAPSSGRVGRHAPMTAPDLEHLIARCALGDRAAFAALYDATAPKLMGVALRVLRERASAEDAVQDTFVKIWQNAGRYRVTGHSPMTWLITIARNTAIDRLRARRPAADIDDYAETLPSDGRTPEAAVEASGETARLSACLDELETARRDAVRAAYLDGLTYAEIAARQQVPLNTIRTWLRRGLIRLRECLSR